MFLSEKFERCFIFAPPVVTGQCTKISMNWPFTQQVSHFLAKSQGLGLWPSPKGYTLDAAKKCDTGVNAPFGSRGGK